MAWRHQHRIEELRFLRPHGLLRYEGPVCASGKRKDAFGVRIDRTRVGCLHPRVWPRDLRFLGARPLARFIGGHSPP
jgi:hypothetical protein